MRSVTIGRDGLPELGSSGLASLEQSLAKLTSVVSASASSERIMKLVHILNAATLATGTLLKERLLLEKHLAEACRILGKKPSTRDLASALEKFLPAPLAEIPADQVAADRRLTPEELSGRLGIDFNGATFESASMGVDSEGEHVLLSFTKGLALRVSGHGLTLQRLQGPPLDSSPQGTPPTDRKSVV